VNLGWQYLRGAINCPIWDSAELYFNITNLAFRMLKIALSTILFSLAP
jgi:hypothetical protein